LEERVKELNIPDLTPEDVELKIKSIPSRYSSLLLVIIGKTILETPLNYFVHISIFTCPFN
jgi:hypothetical protein